VDGFDVNEASEIFLIERQNALHTVYPHRGNQARIVNSHA